MTLRLRGKSLHHGLVIILTHLKGKARYSWKTESVGAGCPHAPPAMPSSNPNYYV